MSTTKPDKIDSSKIKNQNIRLKVECLYEISEV